MDPLNPYAPPSAVPEDLRPAVVLPQTLSQSFRQGVKAGLKWTTFLTGPLWAFLLLLGLGVLALEIVTARGWPRLTDERTRSMLFAPLGGYFVTCLWGVVIGAIVGPAVHLARVARRSQGDPSRVTTRPNPRQPEQDPSSMSS